MTRHAPPGIDASVPVVILKMVRDNYAHGRLGAIRTLGRWGVPVHAIHESRRTPAALSRYGNHVVWPIEDVPSLRVVDDLCGLGARIGGRPVLLATDDVSTLLVDEQRDRLQTVYRFPDQPAGLPGRLADKGELYRLCLELGIPTPNTILPRSRLDVEAYIEEASFPTVVKSMDPRVMRQRPSARSVAVATTADELLAMYDAMEIPSDPNLMLQEYIPGGPETVWMFNGYFDADSECLAAFTGRKIRQHPPGTGATTLGMCQTNDEVEETTRRLMRGIGYRGIVDMGYRYDARDGQYKLLDVNPRLGATFRLFVDDQGMDVVRAMYLDLTGQPVPAAGASDGRRWWVEPFDLWTARVLRRDGSLTRRQWLRSLRGVREAAWFAWDDLRPFFAMLVIFVAGPMYRRLARSARIGPSVVSLARRARGRAPVGSAG